MRPLRIVITTCALVYILLQCGYSAFAQDASEAINVSKPKVFLDRFRRFDDHIKTELSYVNYVRDPQQANIYILLTQQSTGGGIEYIITFLGQEMYAGQNDTLTYVARQDDTENIIRDRLISYLNMGLIRYLSKTEMADLITINISEIRQQQEILPPEDKWDYWVFRINTRTSIEGEEQYRELSVGGGLSANRITENWKINLSYNPDYNEDEYETSDATYLNITREQQLNGLVVKSLTDHWSAGIVSEAASETSQ
ncbi:hypothetical protein ACFL6L_04920 [candidate division KSB1 bacterium]